MITVASFTVLATASSPSRMATPVPRTIASKHLTLATVVQDEPRTVWSWDVTV